MFVKYSTVCISIISGTGTLNRSVVKLFFSYSPLLLALKGDVNIMQLLYSISRCSYILVEKYLLVLLKKHYSYTIKFIYRVSQNLPEKYIQRTVCDFWDTLYNTRYHRHGNLVFEYERNTNLKNRSKDFINQFCNIFEIENYS